MTLKEKIEEAFSYRKMPAEVIEPRQYLQFDSDVEEALWFSGRDWHQLTCEDWKQHSSAVYFLSPEAFAYYLPSLLILTIDDLKNYPDMAVDPLISQLDRSPDPEGWNEGFAERFLGFGQPEFEVLKEWLLFACENIPHFGYGNAASGPGETFGRAFDTIDLLQKEADRRRMIDHDAQRAEFS